MSCFEQSFAATRIWPMAASIASRVTRFDIADVKAIRAQLNVSQAEFARALCTSLDTVKSWEGRRRNPTGLAAKVLASIKDGPKIYEQLASH